MHKKIRYTSSKHRKTEVAMLIEEKVDYYW